jgi:hypothetical protein
MSKIRRQLAFIKFKQAIETVSAVEYSGVDKSNVEYSGVDTAVEGSDRTAIVRYDAQSGDVIDSVVIEQTQFDAYRERTSNKRIRANLQAFFEELADLSVDDNWLATAREKFKKQLEESYPDNEDDTL